MPIDLPVEIIINNIPIKTSVRIDPSTDSYIWSQIMNELMADYSFKSMFQRLFMEQLLSNSGHLDAEFERRLCDWLVKLSKTSLEQMLTSSDAKEREKGLVIRELMRGFFDPASLPKEMPKSP